MQPPDTLLLDRWRNHRDAQAFAEIVARYAGLVYGTAQRILGNAADAEDTAQECFATLAQRSVRVERYLGPWLHQVATRRALNRLRSNQSRCAREQRYAAQRPSAVDPTWDDIQHYVDEAIHNLPARLRRPIVLHFLEGRSHRDIAELLQLPRTTVTSRIAQGVDRVRTQLRRNGVVMSGAALAALFGEQGAQAAPASLIASLGKVALAGSMGAPRAIPVGLAGLGAKPIAASLLAMLCASVIAIAWVTRGEPEKLNGPLSAAAVLEPSHTPSASPNEARPVESHEPRLAKQADERTLSGTIHTIDGQPVAGAEVVVTRDEEAVARSLSADDGSFAIAGLDAGYFALFAFKDAVGAAERAEVRPYDTVEPFVLQPMGAIHGRVVEEATGDAIGGLALVLSNYGSRCAFQRYFEGLRVHQFRTITDSEGRFVFANLCPAKYLFDYEIYSSEYAFPGYQAPPLTVTLGEGETHTLDIALERGVTIQGVVTAGNGAPVERASVQVFSSRHAFLQMINVLTDADGRYTMRGLPARASYTVYAHHEDFAPVESDPVALVEPGDVQEVDIQLSVGFPVSGRLLFLSGEPVVDAEVCFKGGNGPRATTDARGAFTFAHVAPGDYELWCHRDENWDVTNPTVSFSMPERPYRDLVLSLNAKPAGATAGFVEGQVVDEAGQGVPGVRVLARASSLTASGELPGAEARTDEDGQYRVAGLGEAATLMVDVYPDSAPFQRKRNVPVDSSGVNFTLTRYGSVRGRVESSRGHPVAGYEIRYYYWDGSDSAGSPHASEWQPVHTENGAFRLDEIAPPETWLEVRAPGYVVAVTDPVAVAPGEVITDIVVRLEEGLSLSGSVRDAVTGNPVAGARLRAYSPPRFHAMIISEREETMGLEYSTIARTGRDGRFTISSLPPDATVSLVAWSDGYERRVLPRIDVIAVASVPLSIPLAPEGQLEVHLTQGGQPAEGISVAIYRVDVDEPSEDYWTGGSSGTTFDGLPAGPYGVVVSTRGEARTQLGVLEADVRAGETTILEADLDAFPAMFGSIAGTVQLSPNGRDFAMVQAKSGATLDLMNLSQSDEFGHFEITGLPPGDYTVSAFKGVAQTTAEITVTAGATATVALTFE